MAHTEALPRRPWIVPKFRQHAGNAMSDLDVQVVGGLIVITDPKTGFYAVYGKPTDEPHLHIRGCADTTDETLLARVWQAAIDTARELGWIVTAKRRVLYRPAAIGTSIFS
jgi:hypothetical protein